MNKLEILQGIYHAVAGGEEQVASYELRDAGKALRAGSKRKGER